MNSKKKVGREYLFKMALRRIRSASPLHIQGKAWLSPEAALAWEVWVQALMDHYRITIVPPGRKAMDRLEAAIFRDTAAETAESGVIYRRDGTSVNILDLLGIEAGWACSSIKEALYRIDCYLRPRRAA